MKRILSIIVGVLVIGAILAGTFLVLGGNGTSQNVPQVGDPLYTNVVDATYGTNAVEPMRPVDVNKVVPQVLVDVEHNIWEGKFLKRNNEILYYIVEPEQVAPVAAETGEKEARSFDFLQTLEEKVPWGTLVAFVLALPIGFLIFWYITKFGIVEEIEVPVSNVPCEGGELETVNVTLFVRRVLIAGGMFRRAAYGDAHARSLMGKAIGALLIDLAGSINLLEIKSLLPQKIAATEKKDIEWPDDIGYRFISVLPGPINFSPGQEDILQEGEAGRAQAAKVEGYRQKAGVSHNQAVRDITFLTIAQEGVIKVTVQRA